MTSHLVAIDNLTLPPEEVIAWFIPQQDDEVETKVVKRGRPRSVRATEGAETK